MIAHGRAIFIHGMWSRADVWTRWLPEFSAAGYACEAVSLPGHGTSETDADLAGLGMTDYVDAVVEVAATSPAPVLVGHSMGGLIAQLVATRVPVAAMILINSAAPAPIFPFRPRMVPGLARHFATWGLWRNVFHLNRWEADYLLFGAMPAEERRFARDRLTGESGLIAYELGFGSFNLAKTNYADRAKIACPMLAFAGGRDRIVPIDVSRAMAKYYDSQMTFRTFPERAHWMLGEPDYAERIADALLWLDRTVPRI